MVDARNIPSFPQLCSSHHYHDIKMARCSVFQSSASTQPHPYRLATPPLRRSGSPINVVARGHRFQLTLAERNFGTARPVSPEILTEPESSPLRPGRHLHRTYTIGNIGPIPATAAEPTPQLAVPLSSPVPQPLTHDASTAISDSPRDESRNDTQALSIGMHPLINHAKLKVTYMMLRPRERGRR